MEPIKITDKLTLRQEALRLSVATGTSYPVSQAQQFEAYLSGDADLPEHDNSMEKYLHEMKDMLFRQHNPWISAGSDMKPAKDTTVLIQSKNDGCILGAWDGKMWINHNADYSSTSLNESGEILGWMPIPPFTQPTA